MEILPKYVIMKDTDHDFIFVVNHKFLTYFRRNYQCPENLHLRKQIRKGSVIAGRNAVTEALKKGRPIDCIYILKGIERGSMGKIIALAKERGIPIKDAAQQKLDILCEGVVHQGVAAMAACMTFPRWKIFLQSRRSAAIYHYLRQH